jgi:hypothetical protein
VPVNNIDHQPGFHNTRTNEVYINFFKGFLTNGLEEVKRVCGFIFEVGIFEKTVVEIK